MKNVLVANSQMRQGGCSFSVLETYVKAQIENSLEIGWAARDILLLANFDYEFMGIKAQRIEINDPRLTSSKAFAICELLKNASCRDELWVHDLDAWQNLWFDRPLFEDMGICQYSGNRRPSFNGGSVFYKPAARDIMITVSLLLSSKPMINEETAFNQVLFTELYRHRVTLLNSTYNVGCSNFAERYARSSKPVRVCHFHPDCRAHIRTHLLGQNDLHVCTTSDRLSRLLQRHFVAAADEARRWNCGRTRAVAEGPGHGGESVGGRIAEAPARGDT
ncbi:hypothetical protein [Petrachloros mirabilis]